MRDRRCFTVLAPPTTCVRRPTWPLQPALVGPARRMGADPPRIFLAGPPRHPPPLAPPPSAHRLVHIDAGTQASRACAQPIGSIWCEWLPLDLPQRLPWQNRWPLGIGARPHCVAMRRLLKRLRFVKLTALGQALTRARARSAAAGAPRRAARVRGRGALAMESAQAQAVGAGRGVAAGLLVCAAHAVGAGHVSAHATGRRWPAGRVRPAASLWCGQAIWGPGPGRGVGVGQAVAAQALASAQAITSVQAMGMGQVRAMSRHI